MAALDAFDLSFGRSRRFRLENSSYRVLDLIFGSRGSRNAMCLDYKQSVAGEGQPKPNLASPNDRGRRAGRHG
jgi:hypothetical protein